MAKNKTINLVKSQVIYKDYSKDAERTALVSGENLAHMFGKIARWYTDISWVGHTHTEANITDFGTYAGASTKGGAATSANKLNIGSSDIGSETKPVYFNATTGKPVACAYSLNASVPANAVFTDINVKQSPSTANESREVLFAGITGNTETTGTVGKSNKLYFNPSTGALTATSFSGSVDASNLTGSIDAGRLPTTSVTAGSYGPAAGGTLAHGGTFDVGYVTVDKYGRLTAASTKTFTLPAQYVHPTYTSKTSGLYKITVDGTGHVSGTAAVTASDLPAHTHNYISSSGITSTTEVQINPTGASYNEGLRIGKASNGWSNINFGCSNSATAGTQSGQWSVGVRGAVGATAGGIGDFIIEHNGASGNGLTLYADGSTPRWNNVEISMSGHTHPYLPESTVTGSPDLDTYLTTGVYHITTQTSEHAPTTNHATLFVDGTVGTPYQLFIPDVSTGVWYSRYKSGTSAWSSWLSLKMTDTVYTHPTTSGNKHIPSGGSSGQYLKWSSDGTATWSAIAAGDLPSHTHAYLPLSGGTMTGAITFQVADAIKYNAASATYTMISFITGDGNGHGISIGGGGLTVLGSGESASALISALSLAASNETTYIASDNNIEFYSNCQTIGNRLGIVFDTSGRLRPNTNNTRTLGGTDYYWNKAYITQTIGGGGGMWIAARENAIIRQPNTSTGSAYFPIFSCKTKLGEWSIGTLSPDIELLYFAYTTDANYSSSTNTNKYYSLNYDGAFSGSAAKWSTARTLTIGSTGKSVDGSGNVSWSLAEIGAAATSHSHSNYLPQTTPTTAPDLNTYTTTGIYHIPMTATNAPVTQHSTVYVEAVVGTPYQLFKPDNFDTTWYTRHKVTNGWSDWVALKLTDTVYTHPTYTSKTSGLYKITVDGTGHVSATAAVAAADLPSHTHSYLPLAGGTMTGDITFTGVTSTDYPATSKAITFSGSTDAASIFFEVTASDRGCLVLQTTDDADAKIVFRNKVTSSGTRANEVTITDGVIAGNGSGLTNLNASNISSGTLAEARLPKAYIPLAGSTAITGNLRVSMGNTAGPVISVYNGTYEIGLHVGTGGTNHGIYDFTPSINAWMCYHDGTKNIFNGQANTAVTATKSTYTDYSPSITIQTGSSAQAKISLQTLINWLINTKKVLPSGVFIHKIIQSGWSYAANDILQLTCSGTNYEVQLAGVALEFIGTVSSYNTGEFRMMIHTSPTISFTVTSGYKAGPTSSTFVYTCNGSGYAPTWRLISNGLKYANGYWGLTDPSSGDADWTRTTSLGLIPYQSGGAGSGHQSLGTSSWYFLSAYIDTVYGSLSGNASSASIPYGFESRSSGAGWAAGGTFVTAWNAGNGCEIAFMKNYPASGQLSCCIDGYFFQNEGKKRVLDESNFSSYITPSSIGAAASSHSHSYIESKANYTFTSSTLPNSFDWGVSAGFVNSDSGFGSFGSVLTVRTYSSGGGTLQLYAPYSPTYGGTHLKARFGNYDSSSGNSWTSLRELAWNDEKLGITTVTGSPDLDSYTTTGIYTINTSTATHSPTTNYSTLFVDGSVGTPFQILKPDANDTTWYTRHRNNSAGTWYSWVALNLNGISKSDLYKILWSGSTSCIARSSTSITLTTAISANKYRFIKVVWNCGSYTGTSEFRADTLNVTNNIPSGSDATTTNIIQFKIASDGKSVSVGPGTAAITVIQIAGVYPI